MPTLFTTVLLLGSIDLELTRSTCYESIGNTLKVPFHITAKLLEGDGAYETIRMMEAALIEANLAVG